MLFKVFIKNKTNLNNTYFVFITFFKMLYYK